MATKSFIKYGRDLDQRQAVVLREMDNLIAKSQAIVCDINREPTEVNHLCADYPHAFPKQLNGGAEKIWVRTLDRNPEVQVLEVTFGPKGFGPAHTHPYYCVCNVVKGEVFDVVSGKRYDKGDWYMINPGVVHAVQSVNGAVVIVYNTMDEKLAHAIMVRKAYEQKLGT